MKQLNWTPLLIERFWRGVYNLQLADTTINWGSERHLMAALRPHLEARARVVELGNRDFGVAPHVIHSGFEYGYVDAQFLLRPPCKELNAHPRWRGSFEQPDLVRADLVLGVEVLGHLLEDEVDGWFAAARLALKPGGRLALSVRNNECLEQQFAICPQTGLAFHSRQRLRSFSPDSLQELLALQGFKSVVTHQLELSEEGFSKQSNITNMFGGESSVHLGNGNTLLAIAVRSDFQFPNDLDLAADWLARRRNGTTSTAHFAQPRSWSWTRENVDRFWTLIDGTSLDALSFGRHSGPQLLAAVEPWLLPGARHLDMGAGDGSMAELMLSSGYPVATFELAAARRARLDQRLAESPCYLGTLRTIDPSAPFDVVLAIEVIEHVLDEDLKDFLCTIRQALRPGGTIIVSTPNREDFRQALVYCPESEVSFHRWQHVRRFDKQSLQALLEQHGFICDVVHEVDFSAICRNESPCFELLLGELSPTTIGKGSTLLCIAHVGDGTQSCSAQRRSPLLTARRIVLPQLSTYPVAKQVAQPPTNNNKKPVVERSERRPRLLVWELLALAYRAALPIAKHLIPQRIKPRVISVAAIAKRFIDKRTGSSFKTRPVALASWKPMFPAETFTGRPILVNNALAWGGVERQVVYTLLGLAERKEAPAGLLCLRLGYSPDHDFYEPALKNFPGLVRNVIGIREARHRLNVLLTPARVRSIEDAIAWMPSDVIEDILCFIGDFAILKPRVVHVWQDAMSIAAGYAARLLGIPRIILSSRNVAPTNFAHFRPYMFNAYQELISCSGITLVNNSEAGAADYARWLGCSPSCFIVKRNGIDTSTFRCPDPLSVAALRSMLAIPDGVPIVGSVFRFYDEKRPQLWISAASRIAAQRPDVHFVIFGTGPRKAEIQSLARRKGFAARLHCPGTIENCALGLSLFNVFVLTSQFEGTPNVIIEASLLGVPVVTTDAGGTREAVREGSTGIVVPEPEPAAIAQAVLAILNDPAWPRRARHEGPTFIKERFGLERMLDETLMLYQQPSSSGQEDDVLHRSPEHVA